MAAHPTVVARASSDIPLDPQRPVMLLAMSSALVCQQPGSIEGGWVIMYLNFYVLEYSDPCVDGEMNYNEAGVDCGGPLCPPCFANQV